MSLIEELFKLLSNKIINIRQFFLISYSIKLGNAFVKLTNIKLLENNILSYTNSSISNG